MKVSGRWPGDLSAGEIKFFKGSARAGKSELPVGARQCRLFELEDICGGQFFEGFQSEDAEEFRRGAVGDI